MKTRKVKIRKFLCLFLMALAVFAFSGCGGSPSNNFVSPTTPTSPDVTPTPTSPDVTPTPTSPDVTPDTPTSPDVTGEDTTVVDTTLNVNDTATASKVLSAVGGVGSDTQVAALPDEAVGGERSLEDVDPSELAEIPSNETPKLALPVMTVNSPAVYVWGIDLSSLNIGDSIVMHMMPEAAASAAGFYAAADDTAESYAFLDDNGNKITTVPASKRVNAAAYMEPAYTYAPIIAVKDTSSEQTPSESGDVTPVVPTPTTSEDVTPFVPTSPDVAPDVPTSPDVTPDVPDSPTS